MNGDWNGRGRGGCSFHRDSRVGHREGDLEGMRKFRGDLGKSTRHQDQPVQRSGGVTMSGP